jgi:hypothetical protein
MRDKRLLLCAILLSLPAVGLVFGGIYFIYDKVPELIKNEKVRVREEYRTSAEMLHAGEVDKNRVINQYKPKTVPRVSYKMKPGRWGFDVGRDSTIVWYDDRKNISAFEVEKVNVFDFGFFFYIGGVLIMVLFVAMTIFGIMYFWKFVKERDDFLAATAHDLTTPLIGLRYAIGRNEEDARSLNERMLRLVENIKDFLKLGTRRVPEKKPLDALKAYSEAYKIFAADYRDLFDGNDVETEFDRDENSFTALGDETLAIQIMWNLLGNDLKYAAPYGKVKVCFSKEKSHMKISFVDEGQGMTERQMKKAFDRYYRASTVLKSGKGGFGIGLCTAREFARSMGGDLVLIKNVPKGCIFTLTLPCAENFIK